MYTEESEGIARCGVRGLSLPPEEEDAVPDVLMLAMLPPAPPPRIVETARCGSAWPEAAIFAGRFASGGVVEQHLGDETGV